MERGAGEERLDPRPAFRRRTTVTRAFASAPPVGRRTVTVVARPASARASNQARVVGLRVAGRRREQQVVQLLGPADVGRGLGADPARGRRRVEPAERLGVEGEAPAQLDGPGPALLQRGVVEEGVGLAVQDLVGQHRRLGRVDEVDADRAAPPCGRSRATSPSTSMASCRQSWRVWRTRTWSGITTGPAARVLLAGGQGREHRRHEVVGLHALDGQGVLLPAPEPQHGQGAVEVPPPAGGEHGRGQHGLAQDAFGRLRSEQPGGAVEGEAVLGSEGEHDGVVVGGRLQLEVEGGAEALAQRQPEAPVDPPAQRGVHHHLHAAGLVEEALEHDVVERWGACRARRGRPPGSRPAARPRRASSPQACSTWVGAAVEALGAAPSSVPGSVRSVTHGAPQDGDLLGELLGPARGLAHPEGDGGMRAFGVDHPHLALGDAADAPRVGPQQEDVAHHRLDGEVLVDRAHRRVVGLGDDPVVAHLGDGPAAGEGGQPGPATRAQHGVDAVAVQIGHALAPAGGDALGHQLDDGVEVGSLELGVGGRPAHQGEEPVLGPFLGRGHLGHDLLGQDVEGGDGRMGGVETPGPHRGQQRRALDQLVAGQWEEDPLGRAACGSGWSVPPVGGRWRWPGANPPGTRARPGRCRCRAPATPWPPGPGGHRRAGGPPPAGGGPWTGCRGGRPPASGPSRSPRRWARRSDIRRVFTKTRVVRWRSHVVGDAVDHLAELLGGGHRRRARSRGARCGPSRRRACPQSTMAVDRPRHRPR